MFATRRHRVRIYTPVSVIVGALELPEQSRRLSDYLRARADIVLVVHEATVLYADGDRKEGAHVGVASAACLAVVDCEPLGENAEPYLRIATRPVRVEVSYATDLRIEGNLHLALDVEYDNILAGLSAGNSMRVLTDCVVRLSGQVVSEGETILTDFATAAHVLELSSAKREHASEKGAPDIVTEALRAEA